jgi:hypothetical protein
VACVERVTCYAGAVANLTLVIEDDLLKSARKLAIDRDTSVNQMVREYLEAQVHQASARQQAKARLLSTRFPAPEITWTRDDLYAR